MSATSGIDSPSSKNLVMASWRRSWKRRSLRPARLLRRPQANLKAFELTGKGCVFVLGRCCWRTEIALGESGTSLLEPFFVSGRKAVRRFRSILSQVKPKYLTASHTSLYGKDDNRPDVWVLGETWMLLLAVHTHHHSVVVLLP